MPFADLGALHWFVLVVILFLLDAVIPGAHFLWFRLAAVCVGTLDFAIPVAWQWQLVAFGVFSGLAAVFVQRHAQHAAREIDVPDLNVRGRQYVGRSFVVAEAIECGRGRIRVDDTLWCAEGSDTPAGANVRVTGVSGTVLLVEPTA